MFSVGIIVPACSLTQIIETVAKKKSEATEKCEITKQRSSCDGLGTVTVYLILMDASSFCTSDRSSSRKRWAHARNCRLRTQSLPLI